MGELKTLRHSATYKMPDYQITHLPIATLPSYFICRPDSIVGHSTTLTSPFEVRSSVGA